MAMTPPQSALASCSDSEKALIVTQLLDGDPTLRKRAEDIARWILRSVDITSVSDLIVDTILELDTEGLANRAGPRRHGYTEPTDAAWQLLEETIEPWIEDLRRRAGLARGRPSQSVDVSARNGRRTRKDGIDDCLLREWAPDFPSEAASWVERELNATIATSSPTGTSI